MRIIHFSILDECLEGQFQCKAGKCKYNDDDYCKGSCIPKSWVKDGNEDCTDGSDEIIGEYEH